MRPQRSTADAVDFEPQVEFSSYFVQTSNLVHLRQQPLLLFMKLIGVRGSPLRGYFIPGRDRTGARWLKQNPCRRRRVVVARPPRTPLAPPAQELPYIFTILVWFSYIFSYSGKDFTVFLCVGKVFIKKR